MRKPPEDFEVTETRTVSRINLKSTFLSILGLFNVERGFGLTFITLLRSPGQLTLDYLGPKRFKVLSPFQLLVFSTTFLSILVILGLAEESILNSLINGFTNYDNTIVFTPIQKVQLQTRAAMYSPLILISYLASLTFFTWFPHRKRGYNYAEVLVYSGYWFSLVVLSLGMLILAFDWIDHSFIGIVIPLAWMMGMLIYYTLGLKQLFGRAWWVNILRMLLIQCLSLLVGITSFALVVNYLLGKME
ncbi:MAG: DUF3667 domain-containing protein [Bacteroidota bacterium]